MPDSEFGPCRPCTPCVLRIFVDEEDRRVVAAGAMAKRSLFPRYPGFVFNTVACVGEEPGESRRLYSDPESPWFNVFLGYYQVDCLKDEWSRPFGYRSAGGLESELEFEDIVRLGTADWNWFSNWVYGTPTEHVRPLDEIDVAVVRPSMAPAVEIGGGMWHTVTLERAQVASVYEAGHPAAARLTRNSLAAPIWRQAFGPPTPRHGWTESFVPTDLRVELYMAYFEDEHAFHTLIFGATASRATDRRAFLDAQLDALRRVIATCYPDAGFRSQPVTPPAAGAVAPG